MSFRILGRLSALLLIIQLLPFILNFLNRRFFKTKSPAWQKLMKTLRSSHKLSGALLLALAIFHGFWALGRISLHTGSVLYLALFVTAALGGAFLRTRKKQLFMLHRTAGLLMAALLALHYFFPWAFSNLF